MHYKIVLQASVNQMYYLNTLFCWYQFLSYLYPNTMNKNNFSGGKGLLWLTCYKPLWRNDRAWTPVKHLRQDWSRMLTQYSLLSFCFSITQDQLPSGSTNCSMLAPSACTINQENVPYTGPQTNLICVKLTK